MFLFIFFILARCIAGVFGNVPDKNWDLGQNCNRTLHSLLPLSGRSKVRLSGQSSHGGRGEACQFYCGVIQMDVASD